MELSVSPLVTTWLANVGCGAPVAGGLDGEGLPTGLADGKPATPDGLGDGVAGGVPVQATTTSTSRSDTRGCRVRRGMTMFLRGLRRSAGRRARIDAARGFDVRGYGPVAAWAVTAP